jgi:hypothetical protein
MDPTSERDSAPATPGDAAEPAEAQPPPGEASDALAGQVAALQRSLACWISATLDGYRLTARKLTLYAALGVIGGLIAATVLITATVLICLGLSGAVSAMAAGVLGGGWSWLGPLLSGLLVLGAAAIGAYIAVRRITGAARQRTIEKYEQLQARNFAATDKPA